MNEQLLNTLINTVIVLGIVVVIFGIWFVIWSIIRHPIRMKDAIIKERDEARKELTQIQAAKGVEWDKYKEVQLEAEKMRKAYFQTKDDLDKLKSELAKEQINKESLATKIKELKKQMPTESKGGKK